MTYEEFLLRTVSATSGQVLSQEFGGDLPNRSCQVEQGGAGKIISRNLSPAQSRTRSGLVGSGCSY